MKPIVDKTQLINSLFGLLEIPSVKSVPSENAPFGKGVKDALDYFLNLANDLGFETVNYDNYIGEVLFGQGEPFGVLCHLDVVPEGNLADWVTPPYVPTIRDGKIFARGVLDDKGGAVAVLYCMKALKDAGITPNRQIKLILGCDEESGWGCIEHYRKVAKLPKEGISPDADFPVIYAEKGILHIRYSFDKPQALLDITGGERANVVCDFCTATLEKVGLYADYQGVLVDGNYLKATGVSAHGSTPEKGDNAIAKVLGFLVNNGILDASVYDGLFGACHGVKELVDETGHLTFSPNIIRCDNDKIYVTVDVRYPSTLEKDFVVEKLSQIGAMEILSYQAPLFSPKDSGLVKVLSDIYFRCTGDSTPPIAIGGGTYARALENGVAFGPALNMEEGESIHKPNEHVTLSTLDTMTEIYLQTLIEVCCR